MAGTGTYFGIDLGTSSCSVAYVVDDPRQRASQIVNVQTVDVPVDEDQAQKRSNRLPSVVAAVPAGDKRRKRALFGWEFFQAFEEKRRDGALLSRGRDFFGSVKSDLGTERIYPRSLVPGCRTPVEVTALMIERLVALTREGHAGRDPRRAEVVLTVPASLSALARAETWEAARAAGLDPARVHLLDEPIAALVDLLNSPDAAHVLGPENRNVLVFDYGGGTCDVALVRARYDAEARAGLAVENLAISSYHRLGGDDVDDAVMEAVVWPQIASPEERAALSLATRRMVGDTLTPTVARALKERACRGVEARIAEDGWPAVEADPVKVWAGSRELVIPGLPRKSPLRFDMTSAQFRAVMAPFLAPARPGLDERSLLGPVMETLDRALLTPGRLDAVVLHGGSSLNPYVRHLMTATFKGSGLFDRTEIVSTPDPLVSVARGAALFGYWRHARGVEMVRPIMAEDLGIIVRSGEPVPLLAAGTLLPYPDEDSVKEVTSTGELAVPGDALAEMLVPVYTGSPRRPRLSGTVRVAVPPGTAAGTPVRIKVRVDRDKTLHWWFKVGEKADAPASSVNDPWCSSAPTPEERRLLQHRRAMKEGVAAGQPLPAWILAQEANLMRLAGRTEDALLVAEQCLVETPSDPATHNVRGLALDQLGRTPEAAASFRLAADLAPTVAVYRANLGLMLAERGHHDEALAALGLAATLDPSLVYVHLGLGDIHRRKGDEPSARREYTRAMELLNQAMADRPFDLASWRHLARLHQSLGDYAKADKARKVIGELEAAALYEGDPASVVAGPDRSTVAPLRVR